MKRILLLLLSTALFVGCTRITSWSDCGYSLDFMVVNETEAMIVIDNEGTYWPSYGESISIAAGKDDIIGEEVQLGSCDNKTLLPDELDDDYRISQSDYYGWEGDPFTMTIDGREVSDEIWLRKHWSFESDFYNRTYTLHVTDELLEQLGWKE